MYIVEDIFTNLSLREKIDLAHKLLAEITIEAKKLASDLEEMNNDIYQDIVDSFQEASNLTYDWTSTAASKNLHFYQELDES